VAAVRVTGVSWLRRGGDVVASEAEAWLRCWWLWEQSAWWSPACAWPRLVQGSWT